MKFNATNRGPKPALDQTNGIHLVEIANTHVRVFFLSFRYHTLVCYSVVVIVCALRRTIDDKPHGHIVIRYSLLIHLRARSHTIRCQSEYFLCVRRKRPPTARKWFKTKRNETYLYKINWNYNWLCLALVDGANHETVCTYCLRMRFQLVAAIIKTKIPNRLTDYFIIFTCAHDT